MQEDYSVDVPFTVELPPILDSCNTRNAYVRVVGWGWQGAMLVTR